MKNLNEKIKDYWDRQPCNINHSKKELGTKEYFDEVSARRYRVEPHILDFAEFHLWRGKRVLEIGCGIGTDAEQFAKHGAEYVGIDISRESISIALQRFKIFNLQGKFYNINLLENHDVDFGKFDLIYSFGVLHHFPDIDAHIGKITELLHPNGEFRFMVYAENSYKYAMIRAGLDQFEAQSQCPYADVFNEDQIKKMLNQNYSSITIEQNHCFMYNIEEYKKGNIILEPWFDCMPENIKAAIKKYLGWHLLIKAKRKNYDLSI